VKISAIILSAGFSSRINVFKPLLKINERTFLEEIVFKLEDIVSEIVVVLGYKSDEILNTVNLKSAKFVLNENYEKGMFSSLKQGILEIQDGNAFLLNPVDCPLVKKQTYKQIVEFWQKNPEKIIIPQYENKKGHPAIFPAWSTDEILKYPDNTPGGVRNFIERNFSSVELFKTDDRGVIIDIDTIEDYKRWIGKF